jgi:hypothetical protein
MFSEEEAEIFESGLYLLNKVVLEPFYTLSLFPETILEISVCCLIDSEAVLLAS